MYTISAGGCYTNHPAPFTMDRPKGIPEYLLLFIRSKALFEVETRTFEVSPNQMIIIDKNLPYRYSSLEKIYSDDWMHFDCPKSQVPDLFQDILNIPITLGNASRVSFYIQQVLWEYAYASAECRDKNVDMLMNILMNHICEAVRCQQEGHSFSPYNGKLQEVRLKLQSNPGTEISIEELAKSLSISSSYFQHLYTKLFGISFRNDMIVMKINYAKQLLSGTSDTIQNIATLCGYHNEVHFYRQFRKIVGMTPDSYRKNIFH